MNKSDISFTLSFFYPFNSSYCYSSPHKTIHFLPFLVILPGNKIPLSWLRDANTCPCLSGGDKDGIPWPRARSTGPTCTRCAGPTLGPCAAAAIPATPASSRESPKRCWWIPELPAKIHPCLSSCPQALCERLQKHSGEQQAFKIYLLMN